MEPKPTKPSVSGRVLCALALALWAPSLQSCDRDPQSLSPDRLAEMPDFAEFSTMGGLVFVVLPAGTFQMGSPEGSDAPCGQQQHAVTLTRRFAIARTEVTWRQWTFYVGEEGIGPQWHGNADAPVVNVSTLHAYQFCNALSRAEGLTECYILSPDLCDWPDCLGLGFIGLDCPGYRLPTEAEWEYAARAGGAERQTCETSSSSCVPRGAWIDANSRGRPRTVGELLPNAWGLYDMLGNAWEFTMDTCEAYPAAHLVDPLVRNYVYHTPGFGPLPARAIFDVEDQVVRGGSVHWGAGFANPAYRMVSTRGGPDITFRPVRTVSD